MIKIGDKLPIMKLEAFHDGQIKKINLNQDFANRWLALIFYPADFTFVCPTELGDLAAKHEAFKKLNAEIVSVSTDTVFVHKAWHDASPIVKQVNFPMMADPTGKLSREFGVYLEDEGIALRGSFLFNPDGQLVAYEVHSNNIGRSAEEFLRKLQAAIFVRNNGGEVCPANWRPGNQTLKPGLDLVGKI